MIERGRVRIVISGTVRRLGSVVVCSTFGVRICALYLGGVRGYGTPMLGTPLHAEYPDMNLFSYQLSLCLPMLKEYTKL